MNDTEMLDWLQKNGEEIYTVQINETGYLVLEWNDDNGETQRTYGCDLRDAIRTANDVNGFAYDAEILGDDEYRDGIERKLADAHLIAAAHELLAALEDIARGALQEPIPFEQYAKQVARAAIAKAHN